jgi:hypothetical protein
VKLIFRKFHRQNFGPNFRLNIGPNFGLNIGPNFELNIGPNYGLEHKFHVKLIFYNFTGPTLDSLKEIFGPPTLGLKLG